MKTAKNPIIDRTKKTITVTKEFLIRAGQFGTQEFNILWEMQKNHPGYAVQEHKIARNPNKKTYGNLTYENMHDFIAGYFEDETNRKAALEEYEIIKKTAKVMNGSYAKVKSWFLDKYNEEFKAFQEEQEQKKLAAQGS